MAKKDTNEEIIGLLQHLLAIELWRGELSQSEIRVRLGVSINAANAMLKGVSREIEVTSKT
jgi:Trp operon repressor